MSDNGKQAACVVFADQQVDAICELWTEKDYPTFAATVRALVDEGLKRANKKVSYPPIERGKHKRKKGKR